MCADGAVGFVVVKCFEDGGASKGCDVGSEDSDEVALVSVELDLDIACW